MENQHRKISGYRELDQDEIDLMNEIKAQGLVLERLINKVNEKNATYLGGVNNEPLRWATIAKTDFQTGLMALTRAVAKPTFF